MIENAVKILNELLKADPDATNKFFNLGVTVNKQVCDHPTIQVYGGKPHDSKGILRPLGLLNGLIQEDNKIIIMTMNTPGTRIMGFTIGILENGMVSLK